MGLCIAVVDMFSVINLEIFADLQPENTKLPSPDGMLFTLTLLRNKPHSDSKIFEVCPRNGMIVL